MVCTLSFKSLTTTSKSTTFFWSSSHSPVRFLRRSSRPSSWTRSAWRWKISFEYSKKVGLTSNGSNSAVRFPENFLKTSFWFSTEYPEWSRHRRCGVWNMTVEKSGQVQRMGWKQKCWFIGGVHQLSRAKSHFKRGLWCKVDSLGCWSLTRWQPLFPTVGLTHPSFFRQGIFPTPRRLCLFNSEYSVENRVSFQKYIHFQEIWQLNKTHLSEGKIMQKVIDWRHFLNEVVDCVESQK